MDLERTAVAIRPRAPWEAVDLGFRMVRAWWRPMLGPWLVVAVPVWSLAFLLLHRRPYLALVVVWWLRPLLDRVPLFVLSRAVFGAPPALRETVRALPRLLRGHPFDALVLRRLDPARSFRLPVWQLEGVSGTRRRERARVLDREGRREAGLLTFACILMESCLLLGLLGLVALMAPARGFGDVIEAIGGGLYGASPGGLALLAAAAFVAHALVEPCYVAAGFSLYLRARTRLEGWDVELGLRRLAARVGRLRGAAVLALLALGYLLAGGLPALAQAEPAPPALARDPGLVVQEVLEHPDFATRREVTSWRVRDWAADLRPPSLLPPAGAFPGLGRILAVSAAVLLLVFVVWQVALQLRRSDWRPVPGAGGYGRPALPETVEGRDPDREPLPGDVAGAAWELWTRGRGVEALGLLYRGALDRLVRHGVVAVDGSWTEGEVLRAVDRRLTPDGRRYMRDLTGTWTSAAYGHRLPGEERVRALCDAWGRHLGEAP